MTDLLGLDRLNRAVWIPSPLFQLRHLLRLGINCSRADAGPNHDVGVSDFIFGHDARIEPVGDEHLITGSAEELRQLDQSRVCEKPPGIVPLNCLCRWRRWRRCARWL